jgi:hypothetical protein
MSRMKFVITNYEEVEKLKVKSRKLRVKSENGGWRLEVGESKIIKAIGCQL